MTRMAADRENRSSERFATRTEHTSATRVLHSKKFETVLGKLLHNLLHCNGNSSSKTFPRLSLSKRYEA